MVEYNVKFSLEISWKFICASISVANISLRDALLNSSDMLLDSV